MSDRYGEGPLIAALVGRLLTIFETGLAPRALPQDVVDVVLNAITTDQPRLRYLVGRDAEEMAGFQCRHSAEGERTIYGEPDDAFFWRMAKEQVPYLDSWCPSSRQSGWTAPERTARQAELIYRRKLWGAPQARRRQTVGPGRRCADMVGVRVGPAPCDRESEVPDDGTVTSVRDKTR